MPTFATPTRRFALAALLCAASLAGCDEGRITGPVAEPEDANFQDGKRLAGEGKEREALQAFVKVILSRREAPEAHLEAGNLCLALKDPLEAIFHFKQYLKLRPDAVQAGVVQQRIRTAEKEFLKTLPFRPLEGSNADRVAELMDQIKLVRAENDDLKRKQTSLLTAAARSVPVPASTVAADVSESFVSAPSGNKPVPATPPGTVSKPAATSANRRTHTIAKGENLTIISRKYYGTPNRWKDILNANSRVMKNERDLQVGRVLEIPE
jgi:LysM repeat protein